MGVLAEYVYNDHSLFDRFQAKDKRKLLKWRLQQLSPERIIAGMDRDVSLRHPLLEIERILQCADGLEMGRVWVADHRRRCARNFSAIQPRALNRGASLACHGGLGLSSSTCAYDDDGKKQHDFHGESYIRVVLGAMDSADQVIAVDWSLLGNYAAPGDRAHGANMQAELHKLPLMGHCPRMGPGEGVAGRL